MAAGTILAGISGREHGSGSKRSFPIRKSANANSMVGHPLSFPPIELILTSGHFDVSNNDLPERGRFFSKPYRDEEIISTLHHFGA